MADNVKDFQTHAIPLAERLMDYAMQQGKPYGVTDVKIKTRLAEAQKREITKGQVSNVTSGTGQEMTVTLFAGDRVYAFKENTLDEASLQESIRESMDVMAIVPENADKRLLEPVHVYHGPAIDFDLRDPNPPTAREMVEYACLMEEAALVQKGVKTTRSTDIQCGDDHVLLIATNGLHRYASATWYAATTEVIAEDSHGKMQVEYKGCSTAHFSDMEDPAIIGAEAGRDAVAKLGAVLPATSRDIPIILPPEIAQSFFSIVYSAIDGGSVFKKATFLKDKLGQQVMDAGVTLIDDPRVRRSISSCTTDTSGMEATKITFIDKGILKVFNSSLLESRQLGIAPIGRNHGPTNRFVLPGTLSPEDLMHDIKDGVYIKGFCGGKVDVNDGTHSRQAYGTMIKNGKLTHAVDGFVVVGNLKDMFMNVVLGNNVAPLPHPRLSMSVPTVRINGVTIAAK